MKMLFVVAGLLASASPALASPVCDLLRARADEQADILRSPSAILAIGDSSVVEQNAIAGAQVSAADFTRAGVIEDEAQTECFRQVAIDDVTRHLRYASVDMQQAQARAENDALASGEVDIHALRSMLERLVEAHQATVTDLVTFDNLVDGLTSRKFDNMATLAAHNELDAHVNVGLQIERLRRYTRRLEELNAKQQRSSAWDVTLQAGGRQPIYETGFASRMSAFVALQARYSFGKGRSAADGRRAADLAVDVIDHDPSSVIDQVADLQASLEQQPALLDEEIEHARERIAQADERLARIEAVQTSAARVAAASMKISRMEANIALQGLLARKAWIGRELAALSPSRIGGVS